MFYEGLYLYQKTGVNTARTLYILGHVFHGKYLPSEVKLFFWTQMNEKNIYLYNFLHKQI